MAQTPHELSVRDLRGGDTPVSPHDTTPLDRSQLILLVHGYDNTVDAARGSYNTFFTNFETWLTQNAPNRVDLDNVYGLYWPGDKNWGPFSFGSYPLEIKPAVESAAVLSRYFSTLHGPNGLTLELIVIAHSLGNRLLLELLKNLSNIGASRLRVECVCMMAAAVPVKMVDRGGGLQAAAAFAKTLNLHSTSDWVLEFAFPGGETLAKESFFPEAVGRNGNPPSDWTDSSAMSSYGHHDYWTKPQTAPQVAKMFGIVLPNQISPSTLAPRQLPVTPGPMQSATASRALPARARLG